MKSLRALALACVLIPLSPTPAPAATPPNNEELELIAARAAQGDHGSQMLYGLALLEGRYDLKPDPAQGSCCSIHHWAASSGFVGISLGHRILSANSRCNIPILYARHESVCGWRSS